MFEISSAAPYTLSMMHPEINCSSGHDVEFTLCGWFAEGAFEVSRSVVVSCKECGLSKQIRFNTPGAVPVRLDLTDIKRSLLMFFNADAYDKELNGDAPAFDKERACEFWNTGRF